MADTFDGVPICGQMTESIGPLAKWPGAAPRLPWNIDTTGYAGKLTADDVRDAFTLAWLYWAEHVHITPVYAGAGEAVVRSHFARIDGPSNVLAWSMLADDTNSPKTQRYDSGDTWVTMNPEAPAGGIDLVRVACHEIGHVLGLDHDGGQADALMRPSYSTSIPRPRPRDIQRLVGLGYKPRTAPPPPVVPDPPPVGGVMFYLPGGGFLDADFKTRVITYPQGWTGRNS